jgi:hypothetical protein
MKYILLFSFILTFLYSEDIIEVSNGQTEFKCYKTSETEFNAISDGSTKEVDLVKEYSWKCEKTDYVKQCTKYSKESVQVDEVKLKEVGVKGRYKDFSNSITQLGTLLQNQSNALSLWSGWHGTCINGLVTDFDWLTDPAFLAEAALSLYGPEMFGGGQSAAQISDAKENTDIARDVYYGGGSLKEDAETLQSAHKTYWALKEAKEYGEMATCVASQTVEMGESIANFLSHDDKDCDETSEDEICEQPKVNVSNSVKIMDEHDLRGFESFLKNEYPDNWEEFYSYKDYTDDQLTEDSNLYEVTITPPKATNVLDGDGIEGVDEISETAEEVRKAAFAIEMVLNAYKMYSCFSDAPNASGTGKAGLTNDEGQVDLVGLSSSALSFIPMDPTTKLLLDMALRTANSVDSVNSCDKKSDAVDQGSRHEKTFKSTRSNMCHKINKHCNSSKDKKFGECLLDRTEYCCFATPFAKIMTEQLLAQKGGRWNYKHCSQLSLNDFVESSFRSCTEDEKESGSDGASEVFGDRSLVNSYQSVNQCINLDPLRDYFKQLYGNNGEIDTSVLKKAFESFVDRDVIIKPRTTSGIDDEGNIVPLE